MPNDRDGRASPDPLWTAVSIAHEEGRDVPPGRILGVLPEAVRSHRNPAACYLRTALLQCVLARLPGVSDQPVRQWCQDRVILHAMRLSRHHTISNIVRGTRGMPQRLGSPGGSHVRSLADDHLRDVLNPDSLRAQTLTDVAIGLGPWSEWDLRSCETTVEDLRQNTLSMVREFLKSGAAGSIPEAGRRLRHSCVGLLWDEFEFHPHAPVDSEEFLYRHNTRGNQWAIRGGDSFFLAAADSWSSRSLLTISARLSNAADTGDPDVVFGEILKETQEAAADAR